ncbi:hypothetical protein FKK15_13710 [Klebsiella pneumoniae]|nr:hypothetical protein [Klebsiella pneumoniae]
MFLVGGKTPDQSVHLNLTTTETQEQAEWLRGQGVHFLQGYWISRPLSLAGLVAAHDEPANYFTTR